MLNTFLQVKLRQKLRQDAEELAKCEKFLKGLK